MFNKIDGLLGQSLRDKTALLHGIIPAATLEGLRKGCLVVPYEVLLQQIDKKTNDELTVSELRYLDEGRLLIAVRHETYGEAVIYAKPLEFSVTLEDAMMLWQIEIGELKANSVKNKLLARIVEWFPERVLNHLLDEKSLGDLETKVLEDNTVQVEMTRYVQNLPLAQKKLPIINQSPLAWINLSELSAGPDGLSIKCALKRF